MKKIILVGLLACCLGACTFTSGSGDIVTSTRNTGSFTGLSVSGGFDVEVRTGSPYKVVVEADDNLIEDVETRVEAGRLKIKMNEHTKARNAHLKVFVTAPAITDLQSSASADITVIGDLSADRTIHVRASSGSSITADLDAPAVQAEASSGSDIDLAGRTKNFDGDCSSGASIDAGDLLSENTRAEASSGASLQVHASVQLDAKASSGGTVKYRGAAAVVKKESSGGNIEKVN